MNKNPISTDLTIVVFANRNDFFLTKLCIASIRFYYPDIEILLVKDKLNGNFNTRLLRKIFNVKLLDLGKRYYGWGAAKLHFLMSENLPGRRYLCLDSDIIFVGKVVERIQEITGQFVVNPYYSNPPFDKETFELYVDPDIAKKQFEEYEYPGYFFNSGQMVVTPGLVPQSFFDSIFQTGKYPYYTDRPRCPDQTIFNIIIPVLKKKQNLEVGELFYMILSPQFFNNAENNSFEKFKDGKHPFMVHYAGDVRTNNLDKMRGNILLKELREEYRLKLSVFTKVLDSLQDQLSANKYINKIFYRKNWMWMKILNAFNL
jgi:hypothetical protein